MGVGKSSVGSVLAARLGVPFHDLDARIEADSGHSIAAIFERDGETAFRRIEAAALRALGGEGPYVVATGGGLPVESANRTWMRSRGSIVWLDAPFDLVRRRIEGDTARPLARSLAEARRLYDERLPAYRDCDLAVSVRAGTDASTIAAEIATAFAER